MSAIAEPFASIPDDIVKEILLQLPSSASLVRAALVYKHWGRIICSSDFLSRYRKLHPSSPLIGFFFSDRTFGLPAFRLSVQVRADADLKAALHGADLLLADLEQDPTWRIRDSRNGHLLLCRAGESGGDSFSIYNPVSRRLVTIPVHRPQHRVDYFADCLLDDSFRVVSVQQHNGRIRAVEYDPDTLQWHFHPWQSPWALDRPNKVSFPRPMRAAGLIIWVYRAPLALVLDCSSMMFSVCSIPVSSVHTSYAIGEIEDGVGCLVCLDDLPNPTTHGAFKVWLLNTSGGTITWELSREQITVKELLGPRPRVCHVVLVANGLALLSWDDRHDQFVIDIKNRSLHDEFDFRGQAYPYQMAWPPIGLNSSLQDICKEEAEPVQLVLHVEPAPLPQDVDVAAPSDHVGLDAPPNAVHLAARIDDVAYTEGPSDVGMRPLDECATEHVMAAEADNLVGTVEDGVRLMETKPAETAAPSADLVEGMTHSSEAISRKPRCEDVPLEQKSQGPKILCDSDVNADVLKLMELGEAHVQLGMEFYRKAKAMLAATSAVEDVMAECPNSPVPPEATLEEEAQPVQLRFPVEFTPPLDDVGVAATIDDVGLAAPIDDVGLAAAIDDVDLAAQIGDVVCMEGPLDVGLMPLDLCGTEHVRAAEANNLVGTVQDGMHLMETKAANSSAPSAEFVEGKTHSREAISREQICEEDVQLECQPEIQPLLLMITAQKVNLDDLVNHAANRSNAVAYSEVLRSHDPCSVEQSMASKANNLVATADHMEQIMPATPENISPERKPEDHRHDFTLDAHPSDQKLIESYLKPRVVSGDKSCRFIHEGNVYASHPANLTQEYAAAVSSNGHRVWYFFTIVRAKAKCGSRKKRTVDSGEGYWKPDCKRKPVDSMGQHLGYRGYLKFKNYDGHGLRTKWTMVELTLHEGGHDEVTLCKVFFSWHPTKKVPAVLKGKPAASTPTNPGDASATADVPAE